MASTSGSPLIDNGCVLCGKEPAKKGELGTLCKSWRRYWAIRSDREFAGYVGRLEKARRRIEGTRAAQLSAVKTRILSFRRRRA